MLLQKLSHNIVLLLKLCFELLDFLVFGVFLAFDIMAVWLAFKDNGSFVKELTSGFSTATAGGTYAGSGGGYGGYGYGGYGSYGSYGGNFVDPNSPVKYYQLGQARGNSSFKELMAQLEQSIADMRRVMTDKYKIQF